MDDVPLVVIHSFGSRQAVEMARSALEGSGIESMIQADSVGDMRHHLAWASGGFKLLVREEDAATAAEVREPTGEPGQDVESVSSAL